MGYRGGIFRAWWRTRQGLSRCNLGYVSTDAACLRGWCFCLGLISGNRRSHGSSRTPRWLRFRLTGVASREGPRSSQRQCLYPAPKADPVNALLWCEKQTAPACSARSVSTESRARGAPFVISERDEVSPCKSATTSCSSQEVRRSPSPQLEQPSVLDFLAKWTQIEAGARTHSRRGSFDLECLVRGNGQDTMSI